MAQEAFIRIRLDTDTMPASAAQAAQAVGTIGKAGEVSARQTAAAMRMLPAQFTDVATQLAGGQNPLLILLQQGGQVKDSFGGFGPMFRGLASAISPTAVAVGGLATVVGGLAYAAHQGNAESEKLRDTLALTGNAAGLTADRLTTVAKSTSAASQQTVGSAREIALALAATGKTSAGALESQAKAVARLADLSGESATKIAASFAGQLQAPAKFAAQLNESYNFLNLAQFKRIQQLEREGKSVEAARVTNELLTSRLEGQRRELGTLETVLDTTAKSWSKFWDAAKGIGRKQGPQEKIESLRADIANMTDNGQKEPAEGSFTSGRLWAARQQVLLLAEQAKQEAFMADADSRAARKNAGDIANALGTPPVELGAIRTARAQYKADFLRSEKDFYADLDRERRQVLEDSTKDPLGEFITEKVLPADRERMDKRVAMERDYLQDLADANARAAVQLLTDEEERGRALIELDRQIAMRRLETQGLGGDARSTAEGLINRRASLELEGLGQTLKDSTYEDVKGALGAALRDSHNPARAFADALGNVIYQRLTASIADALATAAVGKDGKGGLWGDLLNFAGGIAGGGISVDTSGAGTPSVPDARPRGGMATGTNYVPRDMFLWAHRGEAIVPARYNPAAGGASSGGNQTVIYQIPPGQSPAAYAAALDDNNRRLKAEFAGDLSRRGRALNNAVALGSR